MASGVLGDAQHFLDRGQTRQRLGDAVLVHGAHARLAREAGMRTMYDDGIAKALAGETTIEEVLRVTEDA